MFRTGGGKARELWIGGGGLKECGRGVWGGAKTDYLLLTFMWRLYHMHKYMHTSNI